MRVVVAVLLVLTTIISSHAQQAGIPILERKVTITLANEKLPIALNRIAQQAGFSFSYNSAIVEPGQVISLQSNGRTVREILNEIFKGALLYKQKSNHLILSRAPAPKPAAQTTVFIISGYVEDVASGDKVAEASIYDKTTLASAVTNQFGYYEIKLDKKSEPTKLSVSKKNYRDTIVMISAPGSAIVNISIKPVGDSLQITVVKADSVTHSEPAFPYEKEANVENIRDTLYRDIQISLLPFVGTNGQLSGNVINDYSINIFGGYSLGTRQIELGFFFNADRGDASWLQIAGIGNGVGGNFYGVQAAGIFNINRGETMAAQLAGILNTNLSESRGVQVAGIANTDLESAHGVLVAGIANTVVGDSHGVEIAGVSNVQVGNYGGSQFAGVTNIATRELTGSQISAVFNYGKHIRGTQIGLFNLSDSLGGVPVGLISIVNHGYHKLELSADEVFYTNIAFRTGVRKFYNILTVGMKPENAFDNKDDVWMFGYGIGTGRKISRPLSLNIDLMSSHVSKGSFTSELSLLNKLYVGVDFQLSRKFSITAGGTLNGYLTKNSYTDYPDLFSDHHPTIFYEHNFNNDTNLKMWWGWKVGVRLF